MITIDDERGVYIHTLNGRVTEYPRIHRILAPVIDYTAPEYALNRGRLVHRATVILDTGEGGGLAWDRLDPALRPRLEAYADFKEKTGTQFSLIETPMISRKYRYGGTPDRFTEDRVCLEIKNGPPVGFEGLQLAAQVELIKFNLGIRSEPRRMSVHLFDNGRWKITTWKDRSDFRAFLACYEVWSWKARQQ